MSIQIFTQNKHLATMLLLEARRQGFRSEGEPSLILLDLDTATLPKQIGDAPIIAFSADPVRLADCSSIGFWGLCPLPFSVRKFEEILHRSGGISKKSVLRQAEDDLWLNGRKISLSATEARLFELLYHNRDRVVTNAELNGVLGQSAQSTNTLSVYLYRLRRKLCTDGAIRIQTVRGLGCRLIESN